VNSLITITFSNSHAFKPHGTNKKGLDPKIGEAKHQLHILQSLMLVKIVPTYTSTSPSMGHLPVRLTRRGFSSFWLGAMLGATTSIG
jgi:hypothetical protein